MPETSKGYPYPDPSDPVAQGADAIRALAEKIDTQLGRTAAGTVNIPVSNSISGTVAVTYPAGRFTATPAVDVSAVGSSVWFAYVYGSGNTNGCTVGIRSVAAATTATIPVHWIASDKG